MDSGWTMGQFFVGVIIMAAGFILVYKADWMLQNFGSIPFAEKHLLTEGGSRFFYKLIGILIMIVGALHATDLLQPFGAYIFKKFLGKYTE